ncbi:MAG: YraN family protein [Muribaculaceae bacterium]|nr:YraN family protein [Muribaculaceae bacterium]
MAEHNDLGAWGEQTACDHLTTKGYAIVARNVRVANHEIDVIATKGPRIAFVEVKTRRTSIVDPLLAINRQRMNRMTAAANAYIKSYGIPMEPQFDVITIVGTPDNFELQHYPDAFRPPLRTR